MPLSKEGRVAPAPGGNPAGPVTVAPEPRMDAHSGHYWQYCANCGTKLEGRKCRLICPRCGFYHSCSEP